MNWDCVSFSNLRGIMKTEQLVPIMAIIILILVGVITLIFLQDRSSNQENIPLHLSSMVAPAPPFGCGDIPGSDTSSQLVVSRNNNDNTLSITGGMKGLHPNSDYTVFLSNGYPINSYRWDLRGKWNLKFFGDGDPSDYEVTITAQSAPDCHAGSPVEGYVIHLSGPDQGLSDSVTGRINREIDSFELIIMGEGSNHANYVNGTISRDGTMEGTWAYSTGKTGIWQSTEGSATSSPITSQWPGYSTTLKGFNFTTDNTGSGSWHVTLEKEDFTSPRSQNLSVWINEAGRTILISDNFGRVVG
jgi:hypothetical protein